MVVTLGASAVDELSTVFRIVAGNLGIPDRSSPNTPNRPAARVKETIDISNHTLSRGSFALEDFTFGVNGGLGACRTL